MGKVIRCSIIICDDFNAVLIAARGKFKRGLPKVWSIFGRDLKGKETTEDCIAKAVDKDLKSTLFDAIPFKEFIIDESTGDASLVYTGKVKEYLTPHKEIDSIMWISERELDKYEFAGGDKEILIDYFKERKKS